jgi:hypothetical protein
MTVMPYPISASVNHAGGDADHDDPPWRSTDVTFRSLGGLRKVPIDPFSRRSHRVLESYPTDGSPGSETAESNLRDPRFALGGPIEPMADSDTRRKDLRESVNHAVDPIGRHGFRRSHVATVQISYDRFPL